MTVMLVSKDAEFVRPAKSALEKDGLVVTPVVREPEIAEGLSASGVNVMVLDAGSCGQRTGWVVGQVRDDPRFAETELILFSRSRAELRVACTDVSVLGRVDDVVVETFDGSDLIDRIKAAARRVRVGKSRYSGEAAEWKDPYAADLFVERREDRRVNVEIPVAVKGRDVLGEQFEEEALMVNISAGGTYMKSGHHLDVHSALEISVPASQALDGSFKARGAIVRVEQGTNRDELKRRRVAIRFDDDARQNIDFQVWLAGLSVAS